MPVNKGGFKTITDEAMDCGRFAYERSGDACFKAFCKHKPLDEVSFRAGFITAYAIAVEERLAKNQFLRGRYKVR